MSDKKPTKAYVYQPVAFGAELPFAVSVPWTLRPAGRFRTRDEAQYFADLINRERAELAVLAQIRSHQDACQYLLPSGLSIGQTIDDAAEAAKEK